MTDRQHFTLISDRVRHNAVQAIMEAPEGSRITIAPKSRSNDQNSMFHAMCGDIAKSGVKWAGDAHSLDEWKALLVSAHAVATGQGGAVIPGLEGEYVAIRESTSRMTVGRASSLIEYTLAWCAQNGVDLHDTRRRGYLTQEAA